MIYFNTLTKTKHREKSHIASPLVGRGGGGGGVGGVGGGGCRRKYRDADVVGISIETPLRVVARCKYRDTGVVGLSIETPVL